MQSTMGITQLYIHDRRGENTMHACGFIPEMLERKATNASLQRGNRVIREESFSREIRSRRGTVGFLPSFRPDAVVSPGSKVVVFDAKNSTRLPGKLAGDDNVECTGYKKDSVSYVYLVTNMYLRFLNSVLGVDGLDNKGGRIISTIDFSYFFNNAFFDGSQMVYGSGDGITFSEFDRDATVISHELTHGLIENICPLEYKDQSGALNESIADVFASCFIQWMDNTSPKNSTWLIGDHCMKDIGMVSYSLRSMKSPGDGFINHPILGSDPQKGHMENYYDGKEDFGGVHINSGIPNNAFYLFCTTLEEKLGYSSSWGIPLSIWYSALKKCNDTSCDFARFAQLTMDAAREVENPEVANVLEEAWEDVGILI